MSPLLQVLIDSRPAILLAITMIWGAIFAPSFGLPNWTATSRSSSSESFCFCEKADTCNKNGFVDCVEFKMQGWQSKKERETKSTDEMTWSPPVGRMARPLCIDNRVEDTFLLWVIDYRAAFSTFSSHRRGCDARWPDLPNAPYNPQPMPSKSRLGWLKHDLVMSCWVG